MPVTVQWDTDEPLTGQPDTGSAQKVYTAAGPGTVTVTDEAVGGPTITLNYTVPLTLTTVEPVPAEIDSAGDQAGRTTTVAGEGFPISTSGTVAIATGAPGAYGTTVVSAPATTNASGVFTGVALTVPQGQAAGDYHIEATFGDVADLQAALTVVDNSLTAPTGLTSPTQNPTSIDLTWDAVTGATGYIVQWKLSTGEEWTPNPEVATAADTVAGLTAETSYDFQVMALGDGGATSPWSGTFTISTTAEQTPLDPPANFAADTPNITATEVPFSWETVTGADTYTIRWQTGGGAWTEVPDIATSPHTVTGLEPSTTYEFQIKAVGDGFLDSPWVPETPVTATTLDALDQPTGVTQGTTTQTQIDITWTAVANADTYAVESAPTGTTTWTPVDPEPTTAAASIAGLTADSGYDIRVMAKATGWGDSPWSTIVTFSTSA